MILPAPIAQPAEATSSDHADCGRLTAEAILQRILGRHVTLSIPDNASAEQIAAGINQAAPGLASVSAADVNALQTSEYAAGHYLQIGVNCTSDAVPVPNVTGIRHWLGGYGWDEVYNCWRSTYDFVELEACHNPSMGTVIIKGPAPGGLPLTPDERTDIAAALAYAFYEGIGQDPMTDPTPAGEPTWQQKIAYWSKVGATKTFKEMAHEFFTAKGVPDKIHKGKV